MSRKRTVRIGVSVVLAAVLAMGLWYRRGRSFSELEPYPCDMPRVSCQVFSDGDSRSLEVSGGLARSRIFEAVEALTFHRAATNLIAQPLGLWHRPEPEAPEGAYAFTLVFENAAPILRLCFDGGQWYYQNSEMAGFLPCDVQPDGTQAGEELGALLWEMTPVWETYGYNR